MSNGQDTSSIDLIRWTFAVNPARGPEIAAHLNDLGLDVLVQDDSKFVVTWEEPERDVDHVIEEIWELNGEPFEVTQEEFRRVALHTLHHAEDESVQEAA